MPYTHFHSMDYHEKYKYISDQLNVLKTEMDDLKNEERVTKNDVIHESNFKRGRQSKRRMLDQVRIFATFEGNFSSSVLSMSLVLFQFFFIHS